MFIHLYRYIDIRTHKSDRSMVKYEVINVNARNDGCVVWQRLVHLGLVEPTRGVIVRYVNVTGVGSLCAL